VCNVDENSAETGNAHSKAVEEALQSQNNSTSTRMGGVVTVAVSVEHGEICCTVIFMKIKICGIIS
jgi:hypothetical protein